MKNHLPKLIAMILASVLMLIALTSCGIYLGWNPPFPEGYTGGIGIDPGSPVEPYLFDTYDELVDAVEKLKSKGSTFNKTSIITCEEYFDIKYLLIINSDKTNKIKYGDDPFDRCVKDVDISSFVFFEDVSISELSYSHFLMYNNYHFTLSENDKQLIEEFKLNLENVKLNNPVHLDGIGYYIRYNGVLICKMFNSHKDAEELSNEEIKTIINSIELLD